jgi:hypothetical protein
MTRTDPTAARAIAVGADTLRARAALLFGLMLLSVLTLLVTRIAVV